MRAHRKWLLPCVLAGAVLLGAGIPARAATTNVALGKTVSPGSSIFGMPGSVYVARGWEIPAPG